MAAAGGPAAGADASARAAAVAGAMLGVLAGASSLVWALYKFKPGVVVVVKPAGAPAEAEATPAGGAGGNQVTPLLLPSTTATVQAESLGAASPPPAPGDVDLANYFSPMMSTTTTTTMSRAVQADLDSDAAAVAPAGWTTVVAQSRSLDEVIYV